MSWSELIQHRELNCSSCTLQRYLHDAGFQRCLAVPETWLTEKQKQDRLDWAIEHADWDLIEWLRVIWTDESAVHCGPQPQLFVTRRPGEEYLPDCLKPKFAKPHFYHDLGSNHRWTKGPMVLWEKENWGNITGLLSISFP